MDPKQAYAHLSTFMTESRDEQFRRVAENRTRYIKVVVENLYQPHNASAVLRSCDCFGVQDIHVIENGNDWELNEGVAMGASKWLHVHQHNELEENTSACVTQLKSEGYKIVATTPHTNDYDLKSLPMDQPIAVVFGTEVDGISDIVRSEADYFLRIPMYGFTESFNISVAAALSLYELTDRMRKEVRDWQLSDPERDALLLEWARKSVRNGDHILERYLTGE